MSLKREDFLLPKNFRPEHYSVHLKDIDTNKNVFNGNVKINCNSIKASKSVSLNTRELEIKKVALTLKSGSVIEPKSQTYNDVTEALTFDFNQEISESFILEIDYEGKIQTNMSSFYRSEYKDLITGEEKCTLSTQFEATEARKCFPCFDEPNLKATFEVIITAASNYTVLANMPLKNVEDHKDEKTHTFHTSPLMSTYLVAWALGEYDYIQTETDKKVYPTLDGYSKDGSSNTQGTLPIRIYTAKGKSEQGRFALSVAKKIVDYFSELFEIPYPLPKLDLLCVEAYSHNAMENFSLITFRPSALLIDGNADEADLGSEAAKKVAYVVCHEIAHQWFGNLVTMEWWDELWLNEGFATWVGYLAISTLFPTWDVDSMVMLNSHEVALGLDALKESHPIKMNVNDPKEIEQAFDTISYLKGCSILEMISGYLGEKTFLKGVALYLNRNKFSNATMNDLFGCIGEVANIDLLSRIKPWILDVGYPIINVKEQDGKTIVEQERFLASGDSKQASSWWIPLRITEEEKLQNNSEIKESSSTLQLNSKSIFVNTDGYGFYRVKYENKYLQNIFKNISNLSSRSKMALISDIANTDSFSSFFDLLKSLSSNIDSKDVFAWKMVINYLSTIRTIIYSHVDSVTLKNFEKLSLSLIEKEIVPSIAYINNPGSVLNNKDDPSRTLRSQFYETILIFAGHLSHPKVVEAAEQTYKNDKITSSNRHFVLETILSQPNTSLETFNKFVSRLDNAVLDELENTVSALGKVTNPILFNPCLELLLKIEPMNVQFLATAMSRNPQIHKSLLEFMLHNHTQLFARLIINPVIIGRFVSFSYEYFSGKENLKTLEKFFNERDISTYDNSLRPTLEKIQYNTKYAEENAAEITKYCN